MCFRIILLDKRAGRIPEECVKKHQSHMSAIRITILFYMLLFSNAKYYLPYVLWENY